MEIRRVAFPVKAKDTSKATVFGIASTAMASAFALCGLVLIGNGAPFRFPDRVVAIAAYLAYDPSAAFRAGSAICRATASISTSTPA